MPVEEAVLQEGDWVIILYRPRVVGYITGVSQLREQYRIKVVRTFLGKKIEAEYWFDFNEVIPYKNTLEEDDLLQMIDLALDIKDEQWFKELQERLPQDLPW
jgi:uncharacterized protein YpiB (UPF0302 family)